MAGAFNTLMRSAPLGSVGPSRVDASPQFNLLELLLRQQQGNQQLQAAEADRRARLDLENLRLNTGVAEAQRDRTFTGGEAERARVFQGSQADLNRGLQGRELTLKEGAEKFSQGLETRKLDTSIDQAGQDRALKAELGRGGLANEARGLGIQEDRLKMDDRQFESTFGLKREEFEHGKAMSFREADRADARFKLEEEHAALEDKLARGQMDEQSARTEGQRIQNEMSRLLFQEAKDDVGLTDAEWQIASAAADADEPIPPAIKAKIMRSKKAREAVEFDTKLRESGARIGLTYAQTANTDADTAATPAKTRLMEAQTEGQIAENELVRAKISPAVDAKGKLGSSATNEIDGEITELERRKQSGEVSSVGELRLQALNEVKKLSDKTDSTSVARRQKVAAFAELTKGIENEGLSDMSPKVWLAAFGPLGAVAAAGEFIISGINRMTESEKQELVRKQAEELGYDWGGAFATSGESDE
jgi:hypothetical protein